MPRKNSDPWFDINSVDQNETCAQKNRGLVRPWEEHFDMTTVSGGITINSTAEGHEGNNTTNTVDGHHSHQQRCIGTYPVNGPGSMTMQNSQGVGSVMAGYHGFNDMPTVTCAHAVSPLHPKDISIGLP